MPIGPIMLDIGGVELTEQDRDLLQCPQVGGVILFSRNYQNLDQLHQLVYNIRNCRKDPILIAVDQEGGSVQRFHEGFTKLPPNRLLGEIYDNNKVQALEYAEELGWLMASEILTVGIDLSFAPVLDLDTGLSPVIQGRGFHAEPKKLTNIARAYINGMHMSGMAATGKHFPGHGSVLEDSHHAIPKDNRGIDVIAKDDLKPFMDLIHHLDAIMPAHVIYSKVDELPAGFSPIWLQEILREDLDFKGAIFSDDLSMKGAEVVGDYLARAKAALIAGCDMILVCNNREAAMEIVNALEGYCDERSQQRLIRLCGQFRATREELISHGSWAQAHKIAEDVLSLNVV